jgi:hypothetical protein
MGVALFLSSIGNDPALAHAFAAFACRVDLIIDMAGNTAA